VCGCSIVEISGSIYWKSVCDMGNGIRHEEQAFAVDMRSVMYLM
jgi:hypothetical protein